MSVLPPCPACSSTEFTFNEDKVAVCNGCGGQYQLAADTKAEENREAAAVIANVTATMLDGMLTLIRLGHIGDLTPLERFARATANITDAESARRALRDLGVDIPDDTEVTDLDMEQLKALQTKLEEIFAAAAAAEAVKAAQDTLHEGSA